MKRFVLTPLTKSIRDRFDKTREVDFTLGNCTSLFLDRAPIEGGC
jgi:hypothetical protein